MFKTVPISLLRLGAELGHPIYDSRRQKLLGVGIPIDGHLLNRLSDRGIDSVVIHESDLCRLTERSTPCFDPDCRIEECITCSLPLALRLPRRNERAITWVCTRCGTSFEAVVDHTRATELLEHARPAKFKIDRSSLVHPPSTLAEALSDFVGDSFTGSEQRASVRHAFALHVPAIPVDHDFRPLGKPFLVLTRDISTSGIGFLHTHLINAKFVVLELPAREGNALQTVVKLLRCRQVGRYFEFGGKFVLRIAD